MSPSFPRSPSRVFWFAAAVAPPPAVFSIPFVGYAGAALGLSLSKRFLGVEPSLRLIVAFGFLYAAASGALQCLAFGAAAHFIWRRARRAPAIAKTIQPERALAAILGTIVSNDHEMLSFLHLVK